MTKPALQMAAEALRNLIRFNEELCADVGVSKHYPGAERGREALAAIEAAIEAEAARVPEDRNRLRLAVARAIFEASPWTGDGAGGEYPIKWEDAHLASAMAYERLLRQADAAIAMLRSSGRAEP